jgi:hypothetical protein
LEGHKHQTITGRKYQTTIHGTSYLPPHLSRMVNQKQFCLPRIIMEVIKPSKSLNVPIISIIFQYLIAVCLVHRPNGSWKMKVDYYRLNDVALW